MTKYLIGRILRGLLSVIFVVAIVMILVYSSLDRNLIFATDPTFSKKQGNDKEIYMRQQWEEYGYLDYVTYADFLLEEKNAGNISEADYKKAVTLGATVNGSRDSEITKEFTEKFRQKYEAMGYKVDRLPGQLKAGTTNKYKPGFKPQMYATKDLPVIGRLWNYFTGLITIDNIHYASGIEDSERGISFTFFDPVHGGEKFSPAIIGNGTRYKYLLYFNDTFPYIHQNLISITHEVFTYFSLQDGCFIIW